MSRISGKNPNINNNIGNETIKNIAKNANEFRANDGNLDPNEMKELSKEGFQLGKEFDVKSQADVDKVMERLPAKMDPVAKGLVFHGLESKLAGKYSADIKRFSAQAEEGIAGQTMRSLVTNNPLTARFAQFTGLTDRDASGDKAEVRAEAQAAELKTQNSSMETRVGNEFNKNRSLRSLDCVPKSLQASGIYVKANLPKVPVMNINNLNSWTGKDWSVANKVTPAIQQKLQNWKGENAPLLEQGAHVESFKGFDKDGNIQTASGRTIKKEDFGDLKVYATGKDSLGTGSSKAQVVRGASAHATNEARFKGDKDQVATEKLLHLAASPEPQAQATMNQVMNMAKHGKSTGEIANFLKSSKPPVEFADGNKLTKMITLMKTDVNPPRSMKGPEGQVLKGADGNPKLFKNSFEYLSYVGSHNMGNIAREDIEKTPPDVLSNGAYSDGSIDEQANYAMDMAQLCVRGGGGC